jgi:hypothetical protein
LRRRSIEARGSVCASLCVRALVGDNDHPHGAAAHDNNTPLPLQLAATVFAPSAAKLGYKVSLFERLWPALSVGPAAAAAPPAATTAGAVGTATSGALVATTTTTTTAGASKPSAAVCAAFLDRQYRMRSQLADFVSTHFYGGKLTSEVRFSRACESLATARRQDTRFRGARCRAKQCRERQHKTNPPASVAQAARSTPSPRPAFPFFPSDRPRRRGAGAQAHVRR